MRAQGRSVIAQNSRQNRVFRLAAATAGFLSGGHLFGTIKQWMYQGAFLMRGLEKVRAKFSLTALAYNIRRILNLVAFDTLMAAVKATPG